jgi:hypothetical protein
MVRAEALPFGSYALATPGQLTWVYLNQVLDYEERLRKIHTHCLRKFHQDTCEVCGEPVTDVKKLPVDIQSKIYRPKEHEMGNVVELDFDKSGRQISVEPEKFQVDVELDE